MRTPLSKFVSFSWFSSVLFSFGYFGNHSNFQWLFDLAIFLHLVLFFLVWWSILLSSNLSAASILRICYKAKISFLEWLCHCRGKVPLWPNLVQEKSEWGWWLCGGAKSWLPFFESVQEKFHLWRNTHYILIEFHGTNWWIDGSYNLLPDHEMLLLSSSWPTKPAYGKPSCESFAKCRNLLKTRATLQDD